MKKAHIIESTHINTELTTVITMSKETAIALIRELAQNIGEVGTGHLVLRTDGGEFFIFKTNSL